MSSPAYSWGITPEEESLQYACDQLSMLEGQRSVYYRGVTINASPEVIFRWLCQMRVAPYSYDWIDNFGRKSPRTLTPGLDDIAKGIQFMGIFELVEFEKDRSFTVRSILSKTAYLKQIDVAGTYMIVPQTDRSCRLLVKLICVFPVGALGRILDFCLAWGDFIMMRKQLLTFKALAEGM